MSDEQTLTMEEPQNTEVLNEDEQDSLKVGEEMESEGDQLLAGKYKNAEALEKAHIDLQKKLGEKSDEVSEKPKEEIEPDKEPQEVSDNILDQVWEEGRTNKLSRETFDKLQKMDPVDVAKLAMEARNKGLSNREFTDQDVQQIHGLVGGPDNYNNMMSWAQQNVPEQEINMYDAVMELGNPLAAYFAVQALALKYSDQSGRDGQMITGKAPKSSGDSFKSQAEMIKAMEDDRYADDPAYRQSILEKLERSNINF